MYMNQIQQCLPILDQSQTDFASDAAASARPGTEVRLYNDHEQRSHSLSKAHSYSGSVPVSSPSPPASVSDEQSAFEQNGYKKIRKLRTTQQGELLEVAVTNRKSANVSSKAVIKQVGKSLHLHQIGRSHHNDGIAYCVPNNILKEALIVKYLTVVNRCPEGYIIEFLQFFHCDQNYYLALKHIEDDAINLKQFVSRALGYIDSGQLEIKDYILMIKWIFWQLFVLFHWMHQVMRCCHLDLKLEHVMLKGAAFIIHPETNLVTVHRGVTIRLCDFGSAELFGDGAFACNKKSSVLRKLQYQCPELLKNETYDARKADIWALGIMLFHCLIGRPLYRSVHEVGYTVINTGNIKDFLKLNHSRAYVRRKSLDLIGHMLKIDEDERYDVMDILRAKWFKTYYRKYGEKIALAARKKPCKLKDLPYYNPC
eukprot:171743_1